MKEFKIYKRSETVLARPVTKEDIKNVKEHNSHGYIDLKSLEFPFTASIDDEDYYRGHPKIGDWIISDPEGLSSKAKLVTESDFKYMNYKLKED